MLSPGTESKDAGSHNIWVAGDTLFLGDYQGGLRIIDVSGELRGDLSKRPDLCP